MNTFHVNINEKKVCLQTQTDQQGKHMIPYKSLRVENRNWRGILNVALLPLALP